MQEARLRGLHRAAGIAARARDGGDLPLSFAQERFWFLDRLQPGNVVEQPPRREPGSSRVPVDVPALEARRSA